MLAPTLPSASPSPHAATRHGRAQAPSATAARAAPSPQKQLVTLNAIRVSEVMSKPPLTVAPETGVFEVLEVRGGAWRPSTSFSARRFWRPRSPAPVLASSSW